MINRRALVISSFISSIIAFIFQCLPKAITIAERIDGDRYIIRYSSYFNNPLKGWPILTLIAHWLLPYSAQYLSKRIKNLSSLPRWYFAA